MSRAPQPAAPAPAVAFTGASTSFPVAAPGFGVGGIAPERQGQHSAATELYARQQAAHVFQQQQAQAQAAAAAQYAAALQALSGAGGGGGVGGGGGGGGGAGEKRSFVRMQADSTWEDPTLAEWPANDFRLYVTDLGHEVTDEILAAAFRRWPSFAKARVVRDKHKPEKNRGYGFASFLDPWEAMAAMKEVHGKDIGARPCKVQRSRWDDKDAERHREMAKERERKRLTGGL